jgi:hypothetical protein
MTDTDLRIVGADQSAAFDMSLPHYSKQLVAGRSRTLPNLGLVVDMPDFANRSGSSHSASRAGDVAPRTPSGAGARGRPAGR